MQHVTPRKVILQPGYSLRGNRQMREPWSFTDLETKSARHFRSPRDHFNLRIWDLPLLLTSPEQKEVTPLSSKSPQTITFSPETTALLHRFRTGPKHSPPRKVSPQLNFSTLRCLSTRRYKPIRSVSQKVEFLIGHQPSTNTVSLSAKRKQPSLPKKSALLQPLRVIPKSQVRSPVIHVKQLEVEQEGSAKKRRVSCAPFSGKNLTCTRSLVLDLPMVTYSRGRTPVMFTQTLPELHNPYTHSFLN